LSTTNPTCWPDAASNRLSYGMAYYTSVILLCLWSTFADNVINSVLPTVRLSFYIVQQQEFWCSSYENKVFLFSKSSSFKSQTSACRKHKTRVFKRWHKEFDTSTHCELQGVFFTCQICHAIIAFRVYGALDFIFLGWWELLSTLCWIVTPCHSEKASRFGGIYRHHVQGLRVS
jgi:hypothetical protein